MKLTTNKLIAAGAAAVGAVAGAATIVRAVRNRRAIKVQTTDDLFEEPIVITEEVFVLTEDPDEPSMFTT